MTRIVKPGRGRSAIDGRSDTVDDIEDEFLGLWMDIARLREKVLALAGGGLPPPGPRPPHA